MGPRPTQEGALAVKVYVIDRACMALERSLKLSRFPVPDLYSGVVARGSNDVIGGVESYT